MLVGPGVVVAESRKERGQGIKRIARELSVDRKTVKRWLGLGGWQPRRPQRRARQLDRFAAFIERRAPEVGFNGVVLHRELKALGFAGGLMQVQRFVRPYREQRRWSEQATVRFETGPGEQAQGDYWSYPFRWTVLSLRLNSLFAESFRS